MLPHVFVRSAYSGDDLRTQRKVMWITPLLQALVWSLTFLIGAVGIAALPGMDSSVTEMIIPYIVENIINPVNGGLATVLMILFFIGAASPRPTPSCSLAPPLSLTTLSSLSSAAISTRRKRRPSAVS